MKYMYICTGIDINMYTAMGMYACVCLCMRPCTWFCALCPCKITIPYRNSNRDFCSIFSSISLCLLYSAYLCYQCVSHSSHICVRHRQVCAYACFVCVHVCVCTYLLLYCTYLCHQCVSHSSHYATQNLKHEHECAQTWFRNSLRPECDIRCYYASYTVSPGVNP